MPCRLALPALATLDLFRAVDCSLLFWCRIAYAHRVPPYDSAAATLSLMRSRSFRPSANCVADNCVSEKPVR